MFRKEVCVLRAVPQPVFERREQRGHEKREIWPVHVLREFGAPPVFRAGGPADRPGGRSSAKAKDTRRATAALFYARGDRTREGLERYLAGRVGIPQTYAPLIPLFQAFHGPQITLQPDKPSIKQPRS